MAGPAPVTKFSPYASAQPYFDATPPAWIGPNADDQGRIQAYAVHEQMYWNFENVYRLMLRGAESHPLYIPQPKIVVESLNRFLAKGFDWVTDPRAGTDGDRAAATTAFTALFRRERFFTKFSSMKRFGLVRGDALWHVVADPTKPAGRRISMYDLDPASYFVISDPDDVDRVVGAHIARPGTLNGKPAVRRTTYRKTDTGTITSETAWFDNGAWDDRAGEDVKLLQQVAPVTELPPAITAIPIYHVANRWYSGYAYGHSELVGIERLAQGVNQAVSDEDLALALEGLGVYATTSGPPVDSAGNVTDWRLGPGRVVEVEPDEKTSQPFWRVSGVADVKAYQDHLAFVIGQIKAGASLSNVAVGDVDVSTAESGIALQLKMSPTLSNNAEKEEAILDTHNNMFYDLLNMWFPAYEGQTFPGVQMDAVCGDPLPVDRAARVAEILSLATATPPIISAAYAREKLAEFGYDFPEEMDADIVTQTAALSEALAGDPFGQRLRDELAAAPDNAGDAQLT